MRADPAGLLALCQMAGFAEAWIHGPTPGDEHAHDDPEEVAATARVVAHARK